MIVRLAEYLRSRKAISALEYAVLVGVLVVGIGAALVTFGNNINTYITSQTGNLPS